MTPRSDPLRSVGLVGVEQDEEKMLTTKEAVRSVIHVEMYRQDGGTGWGHWGWHCLSCGEDSGDIYLTMLTAESHSQAHTHSAPRPVTAVVDLALGVENRKES